MKDFWQNCCDLLRLDARISSDKFDTWIAPLQMESWDPKSGELVLSAASAQKRDVTRSTYSDIITFHATRANNDSPITVKWIVREPKVEAPAPSSSVVQQDSTSFNQLAESCGLLSSLSFENFVQGMSNKVALGAATYVANNPGTKAFNPLYIYGGVGLGLLLLDDVQMLGSKEGTQSAFFSTFEALVPHGKQIVLTSDTYAKQLKDVDERLKSRFAGGMSVPIDPPELETREAILMKKAEQSGTNLPEDVAFFIANHLKSNVRELEGALQQVIAHARFNGIDISIDQARTALHDLIHSQNEITVQDIQKKVADYYKIRVADMHSKRRPRVIAYPRQIAMYLSKKLTQKSYPEIGELFGGKDHTTVLHACKKIESDRRINEELNHELHVLEQNLQNF